MIKLILFGVLLVSMTSCDKVQQVKKIGTDGEKTVVDIKKMAADGSVVISDGIIVAEDGKQVVEDVEALKGV